MSDLKRNGKLRWSPSYLRNRGQLTRAQKRALRDWWSEYGIQFEYGRKIDLSREFPTTEGLLLEIGFGMGDHLVKLAHENPGMGVVGIEVHRPGLAAAIDKARKMKLSNLRVIRGDARLVLSDYIQQRIFDAIFIQFPDPWPGERDWHRRIIQEDFLAILEKRLMQQGSLDLVTDVADYASHSESVFDRCSSWCRLEKSPWSEFRAETTYEKKAIDQGRRIYELSYSLNGEQF